MSNEQEEEQCIAEVVYERFREFSTREQMAQMIDTLLSDQKVPPRVKSVVTLMAMILSAEEGHS